MKSEILCLLKESDSYISGQQLCDRFQVSRTAVWKVIDQLKKEGYAIEAVRNRGYRLIASPDVMSEAEIRSFLDTKWVGKRLVCFDETDSTNNRAKEAGDRKDVHGSLFVADQQIAGKGRRGRSWNSPAGSSISMSLLLKPPIYPNQASMLTLVMALSVAEGISESIDDTAEIKWPNDIVLHKKKICGILTEMSTEIDFINYVVIGVGINVSQEVFPEELQKSATSLLLESGKQIPRAQIIAAVMKRFEENYQIFLQAQNLSGLKDTYNSILATKDRQVRVLEPGKEYDAYANGINDLGELIVTLPDGEKRTIYAGEVSVRGLYGYV